MVDTNALLVVLANETSCHSQSLLVEGVTLPGEADRRNAFAEPYQVWRSSGVLCFTPSLKRCFSCAHRPAQDKATPGPEGPQAHLSSNIIYYNDYAWHI